MSLRDLLGQKKGSGKPKREPAGAEGESAAYVLEAVQQMAEEGRRLAIYDRQTGMYAYWYLQLRGDEEVSRASRYGKQLTCISLWAQDSADTAATAKTLKVALRDHDLAGYLNNGHFVILLLETGIIGANIVLERLRALLGEDVIAVAVSYPEDGQTFDALLEAAKARSTGGAAAPREGGEQVA